MNSLALGLIILVVCVVVFMALAGRQSAQRAQREKRAKFIAAYAFPAQLRHRIRKHYPALPDRQLAMVLEGLRQYFLACLSAQGHGLARHVGMPSKAVDDAWHEFILMTREYAGFCTRAFGGFLHHAPEAQMNEPIGNALANTLQQFRDRPPLPGAWAMLGSMPLLFAIDRELQLVDGFRYDDDALAQLERQRGRLDAGKKGGCGGAACGGGTGGAACDAGSAGGGCDAGGGGACGGGGCGSS